MKLTDSQIRTLARMASEHGFRWYIKSGKFFVIKPITPKPNGLGAHYPVTRVGEIMDIARNQGNRSTSEVV